MENFIWHKVSEKEKEEIKNNAKRILEEFATKLGKIKYAEEHFESGAGTRPDGTHWNTEEDFKSTMFSNAPEAREGFVFAEKGGWK